MEETAAAAMAAAMGRLDELSSQERPSNIIVGVAVVRSSSVLPFTVPHVM